MAYEKDPAKRAYFYAREHPQRIRWSSSDTIKIIDEKNESHWVEVRGLGTATEKYVEMNRAGSKAGFYERVARAWVLLQRTEARYAKPVERRRKRTPRDYNAYREAPAYSLRYLRHVIDTLPIPDGPTVANPKGGRPSTAQARKDQLFLAIIKATWSMSAALFRTQQRIWIADGLIQREWGYNAPLTTLTQEWAIPALELLIPSLARPVAHLTDKLALDGTGMHASQRHRWREYFYSRRGAPEPTDKEVEEAWERRRLWEGVHLATCTRLGIVIAAQMSNNTSQGITITRKCLELARNVARSDFTKVVGDGAYTTIETFNLVASFGATLFAPMRDDSKRSGNGPAWARGWSQFFENADVFDREFHARSLVESMNNAIKTACGENLVMGRIKSKARFAAMTADERAADEAARQRARWAEAMAKIAGYSASRVVQVMLARGISHPCFEAPLAQRNPGLASENRAAVAPAFQNVSWSYSMGAGWIA